MTDLLPVSLLDWLMFSLVSLLVLLALFALLRRLWRGRPGQAYVRRLMFSPEAAAAQHLLDSAIGRELRVFPSVRMSDVLEVNPDLKKAHREQAWHDLFGEKLDFVLCSPRDLRVRLAVMLVDDGLSKADGRHRARLLQQLEQAGLAVVHLSPKDWPSADELREELLARLRPAAAEPTAMPGRGRVEPVIRLPQDEPDDEPRFHL
ncbi:hypothetical protein C7I36_03720 [Zobellella taiwanensis]|uniref:DUF2726 domain-containing protein n=1 Tax=Zobellella taiwanensis TaxID=347535 RepID=A0A2P7R6J4_9GAMM|nr:DUF2726 domain-containing protein [Zobellella taiwanensis]PSJ45838.1 hypothetical protein C7I36_03720 [Zobellella taiwanensis]